MLLHSPSLKCSVSSHYHSANGVTHTPYPLPSLKDSVTFEESKESPHQPKRACQKVSLLAASPVSLPTSKDSAFFSQEPAEEGGGMVLLPITPNSAAGGLNTHTHSHSLCPPRDKPRGHRSESEKEKGCMNTGPHLPHPLQSLLEDFPPSWEPKEPMNSPLDIRHPTSSVGEKGRWCDMGWRMGWGGVTGPGRRSPLSYPVAACLLGRLCPSDKFLGGTVWLQMSLPLGARSFSRSPWPDSSVGPGRGRAAWFPCPGSSNRPVSLFLLKIFPLT